MGERLDSKRDRLLAAIKAAAVACEREYLTYDRFRTHSGISMSAVLCEFDSWRDACTEAGVTCGNNSPANLIPNFSRGKDHAISELRRVAEALGTTVLSKSMFDGQKPEICAATVTQMFGGWANAIRAAGLQRHDNYRDPIHVKALAQDFLSAFRETKRIPTVHQIVRRSQYGLNTFTRKFKGYASFKQAAIAHLLKSEVTINESERAKLTAHLADLASTELGPGVGPSAPHHRGRHLGFRAFAFAPTYENEVVSLFSVVADELGFEIICQRPAFPDCEARRRVDPRRQRYQPCLIEFELRSSDYRKHGHPIQGCDLIVCWEHDWLDCPIEALQLQTVIRKLPGWK